MSKEQKNACRWEEDPAGVFFGSAETPQKIAVIGWEEDAFDR